MFLLDIPPPSAPVAGIAGLVLFAVVVLILVATVIVGFVYLLKFLQRRQAEALHHPGGGVVQPASAQQSKPVI